MQFAKTGLATHVRITGCDATRLGNRLSYVPFSGHKGKKKGAIAAVPAAGLTTDMGDKIGGPTGLTPIF